MTEAEFVDYLEEHGALQGTDFDYRAAHDGSKSLWLTYLEYLKMNENSEKMVAKPENDLLVNSDLVYGDKVLFPSSGQVVTDEKKMFASVVNKEEILQPKLSPANGENSPAGDGGRRQQLNPIKEEKGRGPHSQTKQEP